MERPRNRKKDDVEQIIAAMKESRQHFDLAAMLGRAGPSPAGGNRSILRPGWGSRGQAAKPEGSCWERSWERSWEQTGRLPCVLQPKIAEMVEAR